MTTMNKKGDKGSPCLNPRLLAKNSASSPFIDIEKDGGSDALLNTSHKVSRGTHTG